MCTSDASGNVWGVITLDPIGGENENTNGQYSYAIDGDPIGEAPGPETYIREVFLNHYNFGGQEMTISTDGCAALWHAV